MKRKFLPASCTLLSAWVLFLCTSSCSKKEVNPTQPVKPVVDTTTVKTEGPYLGVTLGFQYSAQLTGPARLP